MRTNLSGLFLDPPVRVPLVDEDIRQWHPAQRSPGGSRLNGMGVHAFLIPLVRIVYRNYNPRRL